MGRGEDPGATRGPGSLLGRSAGARAGSALVAAGVLLMAYAGLWQLGLAPGSHVAIPEPVALRRTAGFVAEAPTVAPPVVPERATPVPARVTPAAEAHTPAVSAAPSVRDSDWRIPQPAPLVPADREDRIQAAQGPHPGYATRLAIPSIHLDTKVEQGGIQVDSSGQPEWLTLPFVAVHYGDLTALVGAPGNAVIAGHVATLAMGNVFQFLYQVDLGDEVQVWDQRGDLHRFRVASVKLVAPSDTSAMAETAEPTLTLITCGGEFDPVKREFSKRLVVTALPVDLEQALD